jgi:hypothetical protein
MYVGDGSSHISITVMVLRVALPPWYMHQHQGSTPYRSISLGQR